eukprot:4522479-Pyramimonas_sp.AAC.1
MRFHAADTDVVSHSDILAMIEFTLAHDVHQLGEHPLQSRKGLPTGNALSEPLAAVITGGRT